MKPELAQNKENHYGTIKIVLYIIFLWGITVGVGSYYGAFSSIKFAIPVALFFAVPVISYFINKNLREFIKSIGILPLTAYHIFRIPAAFVFFAYEGRLPPLMLQMAAWGDFIAGVLALIIVILPKRFRWMFWIMHIFGMLDFIDAFAIGIAKEAQKDILIEGLSTFPIALIPLFAVPITAITHIAAFDLLRARSVSLPL